MSDSEIKSISESAEEYILAAGRFINEVIGDTTENRDANGLTESEYLKSYDPDAWKKPSLTADICIVSRSFRTACRGDVGDRILLIRRGNHPYLGCWALPGGFSEEGERIEETAARELLEETGVSLFPKDLKLVGVYSKPGRDPRGWTVSATFLAVIDADKVIPAAGDDAACAEWFNIIKRDNSVCFKKDDIVVSLDELAFDHNEMIMDAMKIFLKA